jgi:hypothetical protein
LAEEKGKGEIRRWVDSRLKCKVAVFVDELPPTLDEVECSLWQEEFRGCFPA